MVYRKVENHWILDTPSSRPTDFAPCWPIGSTAPLPAAISKNSNTAWRDEQRRKHPNQNQEDSDRAGNLAIFITE